MPVYVTGAHVTLGDGTHKRPHSKSPGTKRPFHFKHTCKTPYCCRTLLVIFSGLILVGTGTVMTLTGYKPSLILPWYAVENNATDNETHTISDQKVLDEPGPFRLMVYTGPVVMGVGFFGVMMAVVLFCQIKDRYLRAILPTKGEIRKIKKDILYDIIINEFRKNYFRGIEVPIRKEDQKKQNFTKWSLSLSGSASSFISFARRHSHDLYKRAKRKHKANEKWKNATFPKRSTSDTWMKTSSLPNIKQKAETVELEMVPKDNQGVFDSHVSNDPKEIQKTTDVTGADNLAYHDSPSNKETKSVCWAGEGLSKTLTTAVVHAVSDDNDTNQCSEYTSCHTKRTTHNTTYVYSGCEADEKCIDLSSIGVDCSPPIIHNNTNEKGRRYQESVSKREESDSIDALGMTSETRSITLSWDGDPLQWRDSRGNTEPCALFTLRFDSESSDLNRDIMQTTTHQSTTTTDDKTTEISNNSKRHSCNFKTVIRIYNSNISPADSRRLTPPIQHNQDDTISIDSLDLTDELLKQFEMSKISHI